MYEKPRVNVKVKWASTFAFTPDLQNIYFCFIQVYARKIYVRTNVGKNPP